MTVHSFEWPGGGVLSDHLRSLTNNATDREGGELCFTILDLRTLPYNVSNAYQESDAGDCSNALGSECVQAYLSSLSGRSGQCATPRGPNSIPACASTLATVSCFGSFTASLGNSTSSTFLNFTDRSRYPILSGDAFYFHSTASLPGGNNTFYEEAGQELQAVVISGAAREMMCQKVNKTDAAVPTRTEACAEETSRTGSGGGAVSATPTGAANVVKSLTWSGASVGGLMVLFSLL